MRVSTTVLSMAAMSVMGFFLWVSGCSDLSEDCELNLNCPTVYVTKPNCSEQIFPGNCDACLQTQCCQEIADCVANGTCLDYCVNNVVPSPPDCVDVEGPVKDTFTALTTCMKDKCADTCPPADRCNPVTHNGCTPGTTACDTAYPGVFVCFSLPSASTPAKDCEKCGVWDPPYCGPGLRCHPQSLKCGRYCCTDADCGTGRCELDPIKAFGTEVSGAGNLIGLCMDADPMINEPACDAPATPASGGTCFAGYPGM